MAKKSPGLGEDMQQPLAGEAFNETSLASDGGRLKIGPGGRVVIPAEVREAMGVAEGDMLLATLVDGELRLLSVQGAVQRARAMVRAVIPAGGPSGVDELIADRRREQALEDERNQ